MRDPYVVIMRAARAGRGVRFTAHEVAHLACDEAVSRAAENCDSECVCELDDSQPHGWCGFCDPENRETSGLFDNRFEPRD